MKKNNAIGKEQGFKKWMGEGFGCWRKPREGCGRREAKRSGSPSGERNPVAARPEWPALCLGT